MFTFGTHRHLGSVCLEGKWGEKERRRGRKIRVFLHLVHKRKLRRKWEVWVFSTRTYQKLFSPNWRENKGENVGCEPKKIQKKFILPLFHPFNQTHMMKNTNLLYFSNIFYSPIQKHPSIIKFKIFLFLSIFLFWLMFF